MNHDENNKRQAGALAWLMKEQQRRELQAEVERRMNGCSGDLATIGTLIADYEQERYDKDQQAITWLLWSVEHDRMRWKYYDKNNS